ncbi:hypothetical protein ACYSNM_03575 [Myroides sp. LJL116]
MKISQLKEKAELLIKNTILFVEANSEEQVVAYVNEEKALRFIVLHYNKWMGLIENQHGEYIFEQIDLEDVDLQEYIPLKGVEKKVYPNFEHLMHFADKDIAKWLETQKTDANDLFDLQGIYNEDYIDFWMDNHPLYSSQEAYAYSGGWAIIWPEEDTPLQWNKELEFLYQVGLQNEPFVDIYYDTKQQNYICLERNT